MYTHSLALKKWFCYIHLVFQHFRTLIIVFDFFTGCKQRGPLPCRSRSHSEPSDGGPQSQQPVSPGVAVQGQNPARRAILLYWQYRAKLEWYCPVTRAMIVLFCFNFLLTINVNIWNVNSSLHSMWLLICLWKNDNWHENLLIFCGIRTLTFYDVHLNVQLTGLLKTQVEFDHCNCQIKLDTLNLNK